MFRNPFKEADAKMRNRSSDLLRKGFDFNKIINQRASIVILVILVCYITIAARLVHIQYISNEDYVIKLENFTRKNQLISPPRGDITDRNGKLLVTNKEIVNITYYPQKGLSSFSESKWKLAYKFATKFNIESDAITEREWKDFYIQVASDEGKSLLTNDEILKYQNKELTDLQIYSLKISRITMEMVEELRKIPNENSNKLSNEEKYVAWPVLFKMEQATQISTAVIVEDASVENTAYLIEHKEEFVGFDITISSKRVYPYEYVLRDVLGKVSTNGLEQSSKDYYLANGYALNDNIGISGLEKQYEEYLSGTKTVKEIKYDEDTGSPIFNTIKEGKKGYDLQLTFDIDLQLKVDQIIKNKLSDAKKNQYRKDFNQLFFSMMNPQTGEIIVMSGQQITEDGDFIPFASGNYLQSFLVGSTVKPAVLYMGLNEGAVKINEKIYDQPMIFKGALVKKSYTNKGLINEIEAIRQSSNVYMFHIAIRLGGGYYTPYGSLYLPNLEDAYQLYRKYFAMFGLGTKTQLDIPYEESGYPGSDDTSGHLLDFSIGQYESYTPIQLLQYVSTLGSGVKVAPHFMKQIFEINDDETVIRQYDTNVLSTLSGDGKYLERVKEGMRQCASSGSCGYGISTIAKEHDLATKTGTAEVGNANDNITNALLIGFAPSENPTMSFVCVAPTSSSKKLQSNICGEVVHEALVEYYKMK